MAVVDWELARRCLANISRRGLSVYDHIEVGDPELWIPTTELSAILSTALKGMSLAGLPLRTRSRRVKEAVCTALGYPIPRSFTRSHPRFPGQMFDTYVQKSNNLQVWNEEVAPDRRYVVIKVSRDDVIEAVRVLRGEVLGALDTTSTLTRKYQARLIPGPSRAELVVDHDTDRVSPLVRVGVRLSAPRVSPADYPEPGMVLPIREIFNRLQSLLGKKVPWEGSTQERRRGGALHRLVCRCLGYHKYHDPGDLPDIRHQLAETKLQTSPTIDLGLSLPYSELPLDIPKTGGQQFRRCDVRYVLFYGRRSGSFVQLTHLYVTTGAAFRTRFPMFQGKVLNKKLQIRLPRDFFAG